MERYQRNRQEENPSQISTHPLAHFAWPEVRLDLLSGGADAYSSKGRNKKPSIRSKDIHISNAEVEKSPWQHPPKIAQPVRSGETCSKRPLLPSLYLS